MTGTWVGYADDVLHSDPYYSVEVYFDLTQDSGTTFHGTMDVCHNGRSEGPSNVTGTDDGNTVTFPELKLADAPPGAFSTSEFGGGDLTLDRRDGGALDIHRGTRDEYNKACSA